MWQNIFFTFLGVFMLLLGGIMESYCTISRQCQPSLRAKIFGSRRVPLLYAGWILLLVIGALLLWMVNGILMVVSVVVFWVLLPLLLMPMVKRRVLPPWDVVKGDLGKHGYTEDNYLKGDWWMKKRSKEIELHLKGKRK